MRERIATSLPLFALCLLLLACAGTARLYPANDRASEIGGILALQWQETGLSGTGKTSVQMPDGEIMTGEFTVIRQGTVGFGNIFGQVYGPKGMATGTAFGTSFTESIQKPFAATLIGNKGGRMTCEGYTSNYHGTGACEHSNGSLYRMHF